MLIEKPSPEVYKALVEIAYRCWNPDKLQDIELLMVKYSSREADLFHKVISKYVFGIRPASESQLLICEIFARFDPEKLRDMPRLLQVHRGQEAELYRSVCDRYLGRWTKSQPPLNFSEGETSEGMVQICRLLVEEAYDRWNPAKLADVGMLMTKFSGRELELVDQITCKYFFAAGPSPLAMLQFFAEFAARFAPHEIMNVELMLHKCQRREVELYRHLCKKYLQGRLPRGSEQSRAPALVEKKREVFEALFQTGPLGMGLKDAVVAKVVPGQQAASFGVEVGHELVSLGGQDVPMAGSEEEIKEWVLCWVQGVRPLHARFSREVNEDLKQVEPDTARSGSARGEAETMLTEVEGGPGAFWKQLASSEIHESDPNSEKEGQDMEAGKRIQEDAEQRLEKDAVQEKEKEAEAKAQQEAEEREAQERAQKEAEEREAEEMAQSEAAERARKEVEQREAEQRAQQEAEEREAQERAQKEAEERKAEEMAQSEAAERARKEVEQREAEERAQQEAEGREAQERAQKEAEEREGSEVSKLEAESRVFVDENQDGPDQESEHGHSGQLANGASVSMSVEAAMALDSDEGEAADAGDEDDMWNSDWSAVSKGPEEPT